MKIRLMQALAGLALLLSMNVAQAAITCNMSSAGVSAVYPSGSATQVIAQGSFTVSCTRGLTTDPLTTNYSMKAGNGLQPAGTINQAASGANLLQYDLYVNSTCGTKWKANNTIPSPAGTITMVGLNPTSVTQNFWLCINAGTSAAAGTYTDSVTIVPTYNNGVLGGSTTFPVSITVPGTCTINAGPGAITLAYTAFQTSAATDSTTFSLTCNNAMPYSMSVSPASNALTGIRYLLSLTPNATGTGVAQTQTISGSAQAGQAGTCATGSCNATQITTLTISF